MKQFLVGSMLLVCSGCATLLSNQFEDPSLYAGTRHDAQDIQRFATEKVPGESELLRMANIGIRACDLPLSVVADTVLLPIYLGQELKSRLEHPGN